MPKVVLHLHVEVPAKNLEKFMSFCRKAFPIYESGGGCQMALYENKDKKGCFDEVAYYSTVEDYEAGERAVAEDPVQKGLIKEWRALLKGPPQVSVFMEREIDEDGKD